MDVEVCAIGRSKNKIDTWASAKRDTGIQGPDVSVISVSSMEIKGLMDRPHKTMWRRILILERNFESIENHI
jgi:hypothetical protein